MTFIDAAIRYRAYFKGSGLGATKITELKKDKKNYLSTSIMSL